MHVKLGDQFHLQVSLTYCESISFIKMLYYCTLYTFNMFEAAAISTHHTKSGEVRIIFLQLLFLTITPFFCPIRALCSSPLHLHTNMYTKVDAIR